MHTTRNRRAAALPGKDRAAKTGQQAGPVPAGNAPPPVFPAGLVAPRPLGVTIISQPLPEPADMTTHTEAGSDPARRKAVARRGPAKPKPARAKRKRTARPRKAAAGKGATRTTKPRKQAAGEAETPPVEILTPALPLPARTEALVRPDEPLSEIAPIPRSHALAPYRKGGFLGLIGFWMRDAGRMLKGATRKRTQVSRQPAPQPVAGDLARLRAENERLRSQLAALLALQEGGIVLKDAGTV